MRENVRFNSKIPKAPSHLVYAFANGLFGTDVYFVENHGRRPVSHWWSPMPFRGYWLSTPRDEWVKMPYPFWFEADDDA